MQRGLEAMTATLTSRRVQGQMTNKVNPEEIIKQMVAMGFGPGDEPAEGQTLDSRERKRK